MLPYCIVGGSSASTSKTQTAIWLASMSAYQSRTSAGEAGIGLVTMDGARIRNVSYANISLRGASTPVFLPESPANGTTYIYHERGAALGACKSAGYAGLCSKSRLEGHSSW